MIAKTYSIIPFGYSGALVEIEGVQTHGLPAFNIVGMASKTVCEARERVKSAIKASGFFFPDQKLTMNLAPADLEKDGTQLDLALAVNILVLSGQLLEQNLEASVFIGELSLDGTLKPVRGVISIAETAKDLGFKRLFIPYKNFAQASLITGMELIPVKSLSEVFLYLKGQMSIAPPNVVKNNRTPGIGDGFNSIIGQDFAKRALIIAIAGHHNILLSGPPGTGKTILVKNALELLPNLSEEEQISLTKIHSLIDANSPIITKRPFRAPHHTCTMSSFIGGGRKALPGEITLAHHGILFLDELLEYPRAILESLRQPLEDRTVSVSRLNARVTYPADFILVATMNPCPCGYLGDKEHACTCTESQIQNYQKKLSGPLLDRIDLFVSVGRVDPSELLLNAKDMEDEKNTKSSSRRLKDRANNQSTLNVVKNNITDALNLQRKRYQSKTLYNASLSSNQVAKYLELDKAAKSLLDEAARRMNLSARSYFKVIKVAQTIADLDAAPAIKTSHISEALAFRRKTF